MPGWKRGIVMKRKRLTQIFPWLLPVRRKQRTLLFYTKMKFDDVVIGKDCWIYQNVTIGESNRKAPVIGDGCLIGAGAVIVGDVRIGNHVKIGAGAVVNIDIADGCTVVAQPPRIMEKR